MRDVVLPRARQGQETYAYSLEEIMQMLVVLSEPAATIVATAAFTGARRGEIRGMLWENYSEGQIRITQSVWRSHIDEPKTRESAAPVPVIPALARFLEKHRLACGDPKSGLMFANTFGRPLDLDQLAREVIKPALEKAKLSWHGWHAFRRGLATNLHRLGVQDKIIQAILRHSTITVTQNAYIKTVSADATAAMKTLEAICAANYATNMQPGTKNEAQKTTQ